MVPTEGESVDDGGAEPRVGEGLGPAGEGLVGRDRDGRLLLALGQDLKEQLGAAAVQLHVPEFVDAQQIDPSVARDGLRQRLLVGGLDQFVGELGGQRVLDTEAGYRSLGAERDQEMGLAGAGVPDQAQRLALLGPLALGQGVDDRGIDAGVGLEVEAA